MKNRHPTTDREAKFKIAMLILLAAMIALVCTELVAAASIGQAFGNLGSSIGGFFNNYATQDGPGFLDFLIFAVIFFTICWIALKSVFKDAKNANIVLSLALGISMSIALVYAGKFTIKKILPFAMVVLFILMIAAIYALIKKFIFTGNTAGSKFISFLVAALVSIAILMLALNFMCSDNNCENNAFLRKFVGSESIFGRMFDGIGDSFTSASSQGSTPAPPTQAAARLCGNGIPDPGENCDPGSSTSADTTVGCASAYEVCDFNCQVCVSPSWIDSVLIWLGNYWYWIPIALAFLVATGIGIKKRKGIAERTKRWWKNKKRKAEISALNRLLEKLDRDEKIMSDNIKQLINNVRQEKSPFENTYRHIVDNITRDIKETIGEEIEFIKKGDQAGLSQNVKDLHRLNNHEKLLVQTQIIPTIQKELNTIKAEFAASQELMSRINDIENVKGHYDEKDKILDSFRHYEFKEKNVIANMQKDLKDNSEQFDNFSKMCEAILPLLEDERKRIENLKEGKVKYNQIIESIKVIRTDAIKLNQIFASKVNLLQYIIRKMESLKEDVHQLHDAEVGNIKDFMVNAEKSESLRNYDSAVYFATHVAQNAKFLINQELKESARAELQELEKRSTELIERCIPKVIDTALPEIDKELSRGEFKQVKEVLEHIKEMEFDDEELVKNLHHELSAYNAKMEKVDNLITDTMKAESARRAVFNALGIKPVPPWEAPEGALQARPRPQPAPQPTVQPQQQIVRSDDNPEERQQISQEEAARRFAALLRQEQERRGQ